MKVYISIFHPAEGEMRVQKVKMLILEEEAQI